MSDLAHPRVKRHFSIVAHSADVVELRHGAWNAVSHTLADESESGRLLRMVRRLDGSLDARGVAAAEDVPLGEVEALLDHLDGLGALEYGSSSAIDFYADHAAAFLRPPGTPLPAAPTPLVVGDDGPLGTQLRELLGAEAWAPAAETRAALVSCARASIEDGLEFERAAAVFDDWRGRLVVHASARVNPLELRGLNRVCMQLGTTCISGAVDGPFLLVGPTVVPHRSACFECLETRVLMNLREAASYQAYKHALFDGRAADAATPLDGVLASLLASLVSVEALNFALAGASFTVGKLLAVHLPTMEFTYNEVLRVPGCAGCGAAPERDELELYFDIRTLLDGAR